MLYSNRKSVKFKRLSYATNQFSVAVYREIEKKLTEDETIVINDLHENDSYLLVVVFPYMLQQRSQFRGTCPFLSYNDVHMFGYEVQRFSTFVQQNNSKIN